VEGSKGLRRFLKQEGLTKVKKEKEKDWEGWEGKGRKSEFK
jgi:hypothetical protein